jgi:hypothetical protein
MLAQEIEDHLRALLRDVICGHLGGELVALADSLLVEEDAPTARPGGLRLPRPQTPPTARSDEWFDQLEEDYCAAEGGVPFTDASR